MMRARLVLTAAVAGVAGVAMVPAAPATASCAEESGPAGSPVIFVGTAEVERRGYTQFEVDEVWAGPDLAPQVWVLSGQQQPPWPLSLFSAVGSSIDAEFVDGEQYVVGASRSFSTSACSVSEAVDTKAPGGVREPTEDGATGADPPIGPVEQVVWVAGTVAALAAVTRLLRRRRTGARRAELPTPT